MCGITGFSGFRNDRLLARMCELIKHRGPDQAGAYLSDKVSLGHRRLSIIDLSERGRQPMSNEDNTIHLVFNGEIYNFKELKSELIKRGHTFLSESDSEVILHAYEEKGADCVTGLRGMFSFAIWDSKKERLILCRDRLGKKPLYYKWDGRVLLFASEVKALLASDLVEREIDEDAYHSFLAFQYVPGNRTAIKGILRLPPGHMAVLEKGALDIRKYWDIEEVREDSRIDFRTAVEETRRLLAESVRLRLVSDVPLGVLLSGGLDSSSVVAAMSGNGVKRIKTFTVGFGEKGDEFEYARLVSERFRTDHCELTIKPGNLIDTLEKIVWHLDEPIADGGAFATYLVSEVVKEHVKVILVGEGADELFGGYSWHKLANPLFSSIPRFLKKRMYFYLNTFYRGQKNSYEMYKAFDNIFEEGRRKDFFTAMSCYEMKNLIPNCLLMKVDKMSMAHSIEARAPFLDHKLVEFAASLPKDFKINGFTGKHILREAMKGLLPDEIIKRKKRGFLIPLGRWMESGLKDYAYDILTGRNSFAGDFLGVNRLHDMFAPHRGLRKIEYDILLWRLLIFEVWRMFYIKGGADSFTGNHAEGLICR